jgi:hypothetical protein
MLNRAPSLRRLTLALLCLVGLIGLFFAVRCSRDPLTQSMSAKTPDASSRLAHLTMLNSSDCEWQIVITPASSGDSRMVKLAAAKSVDFELAGGDYDFVQTMLAADAKPDSVRRFSIRLEAGQFYRWRLMSLLSGAPVDASLPSERKDRHE